MGWTRGYPLGPNTPQRPLISLTVDPGIQSRGPLFVTLGASWERVIGFRVRNKPATGRCQPGGPLPSDKESAAVPDILEGDESLASVPLPC